MAACQVRALLMGGQACVFYGAAEFSRDTDLLVLAESTNLEHLQIALPRTLRGLEQALAAEVCAEREQDRVYWQPLKTELEQLRHPERNR
jgi:hypothetical protein